MSRVECTFGTFGCAKRSERPEMHVQALTTAPMTRSYSIKCKQLDCAVSPTKVLLVLVRVTTT